MNDHNFDTFPAMPVSEQTREALAAIGYTLPTPIQKLVLPVALAGRDLLGQAQTGTGKTLAFGIPIVERIDPALKAVQAIILTPTRELARQVNEEIKKIIGHRGLEILAIYGGVSQDTQVAGLKRGAQIVVGTPGRVWDLFRQRILRFDQISIAVLDEVDEMLDMGFYEDVEAILAKTPPERQTMFFSATIPPRIQGLGRRYLRRPEIISTSDENVMADTTTHVFYEVEEHSRFQALCDVLETQQVDLGLIFCRTKYESDRVFERLQEQGFSVERLHGDLPQAKRESVMRRYRAGELHLLVATDVAARGLDVQGLSHVINYHIPFDAESYVHRTGRTGRAGAAGRSITFVSPAEYYELVGIQNSNTLFIEKCELPSRADIVRRKLEKMIEKILEELKTADIEAAYKIICKKVPLTKRGKALALVLMKMGGLENVQAASSAGAAGDQARVFINLGRNHRADEKSLHGLLKQAGGLDAGAIGKIDVLERFSFVNLAKDKAEAAIEKLNAAKFNNYSIKAEISRNSGGSGERGGSGRGPGRPGGSRDGMRSGGASRPGGASRSRSGSRPSSDRPGRHEGGGAAPAAENPAAAEGGEG